MSGKVIWMCGPSGAGKSTIAQRLLEMAKLRGIPTKILDGDELRQGISNGLGLSPEDRQEHNRRVAYLAKSISEVEGLAIVALISPVESIRQMVREIVGEEFYLVYIESSMQSRIERDPKGLYAKAIRGEITKLTGYDGNFEVPEDSDVVVNTNESDVNQCATNIFSSICFYQ